MQPIEVHPVMFSFSRALIKMYTLTSIGNDLLLQIADYSSNNRSLGRACHHLWQLIGHRNIKLRLPIHSLEELFLYRPRFLKTTHSLDVTLKETLVPVLRAYDLFLNTIAQCGLIQNLTIHMSQVERNILSQLCNVLPLVGGSVRKLSVTIYGPKFRTISDSTIPNDYHGQGAIASMTCFAKGQMRRVPQICEGLSIDYHVHETLKNAIKICECLIMVCP
jgi:hypothetical protein